VDDHHFEADMDMTAILQVEDHVFFADEVVQ
jgi:hypothetical protein